MLIANSYCCFWQYDLISLEQKNLPMHLGPKLSPIAVGECFTVTWLVWNVLKPVPKWIIPYS